MTKTEKVFISGPMKTPDYQRTFAEAADRLVAEGYEVLNPAAAIPADADRPAAIRISLAMVDAADALFFLPGWMGSLGCYVERAYGNYLGKRIFGNPPAPPVL